MSEQDTPTGATCYWEHVAACPGSKQFGNGHWRLFKLLTPPDSQPKAMKSEKVGVYTGVLHLAPGNISGEEMCPWRTAGCTQACLGVSTGRVRSFPNIQEARIRRTLEFKSGGKVNPAFMEKLSQDVAAVRRAADRNGMQPAVRLNGTSDQPWEAIRVTVDGREYKNLMEAYPDVRFYDYTKSPTRIMRSLGQVGGTWPANYHLTYSYSDAPHASETAEKVLAAGGNVSAVFRRDIPATWHGHPVVDATKHDARFLDPPGTVAGLRALGTAVKDTSGFVLDAPLDGPGGEERTKPSLWSRDRSRGRGSRHIAIGTRTRVAAGAE